MLGGDGTINEAANGMVGTQVPLGVLPGGTANVLAMELGLGWRLERAAGRLGKSVEKRIPAMRMIPEDGEARYFLLLGGVGLDATIVNKVNPQWKAKAGKLAYWAAGFTEFFRSLPQFGSQVNGQTFECGFALASRVRNYGGDLEIASGASLLRPDIELVLFAGTNPIRYMAYMASVIVRLAQKLPGVTTFATDSVKFSGRAPIQLDGEFVGYTPARFEVVPDALTLLMPEDYR